MSTLDEKQAFSERLKLALKRSKKKVETPGELALQFNLRHKHDPITPQSAQKWLAGKSIPTHDKIETLAAWLGISVPWLKFGIQEPRPVKASKVVTRATTSTSDTPNQKELKLLQRIRSLPESRKKLVFELVEEFAIEQEIWQS